ncbi:MAG: ABC transporter ATP-binding protein [Gammaproteobacteria bacterium]|nr:ABC transporter ATP-binding protein [Gammaproteobacteria bacterium]MDE1983813.1 ABC transporter ATP-binding protein [Gammaproteobacteria bacterium]MDE2108222.1 ABC transporter ATP-binding protein [Gammaproteobacteria bacterium]
MGNIADTRAPIAVLKSVTKRYGPVTAVDKLSLDIRRGEVLALLGPNGAGKTTSVNLLLDLAWPASGSVELFGLSPREVAARRRIGAMLQGAQLGGHARVHEVIALQSGYYLNPLSLTETLHTAGLDGLEHRPVTKLSGGQKQRLLFALAICGNSELLFLDEPTVGLDVEARRGFWSSIRRLKEQGRSIVLTTHYIEEADALADRIVVINRGRVIAAGTPAEIKRTVAQRHIRCITKLKVAQIQTLPEVTSVNQEGERLDIVAARPESVLFEMLKLDPALHDLEVTGAKLEEAFLALTDEDHEEQAA